MPAGCKGKYSEKMVKSICELTASGEYTIKSICKKVGIAQSTYFDWLANKLEFSERIKKAEEEQNRNIIKLAKKQLYKKIEGYNYEEETIDQFIDKDGNKRANKKIVTKYVPPSDTAIIFAIKNYENGIKEDSNGNQDPARMVEDIKKLLGEVDLGV
jgi:transposase-like protein